MSTKLPLNDEERKSLRKHKIKLAQVGGYSPRELCGILGSSTDRAKTLTALAQFQSISSIGPKLAKWLTEIGYFSLDGLKEKDGAVLTDEMEAYYGHWMDPCVEDSLRLVVHYAKSLDDNKRWWDFTEERKSYRAKYGYPETRPKKAWYE